jgi:MoaA/NifB/PqqE/SkfB family radical SAM enzyme
MAAGKLPEIVFPVFTNGTMLSEDYIKLFDKHRNLIPIISIEGNEETTDLRRGSGDMLFISFPGDEKTSGGCLAAGRGFFHINPQGGAEPCPFSPYSDTSLQKVSLWEALNSPLFCKLRASNVLLADHTGGCVLFEQEATVQNLLNSSTR